MNIQRHVLTFILIPALTVFYTCAWKDMAVKDEKWSEELAVSEIFGDNMVLQRDADVAVWGWGMPGKYVRIDLDTKIKTVKVNKKGKWKAGFRTGPAGRHVDMTIYAKDSILIHNIVYGDVWLCAGQSNMEMPLGGWGRVLDYRKEIAAANYPDVRLFKLNNAQIQYSYTAEEHVRNQGGWKACSPENIEEFSALAYFFGRKIHRETGVPVGLIQATSGGTPIEAWMPRESCAKYDDIIYRMGDVIESDMARDKEKEKTNKKAIAAWYEGAKKYDKGLLADIPWYSADLDDSQWTLIRDIPEGFWYENGFEDVKGVFWYRKKIMLPDNFNKKQAILRTGQIYERSELYVNGILIGNFTSNAKPSEYIIPEEILRLGKNQIALRISANRTNGGMRGLPEDYFITTDKDTISLTGSWRIAKSFDFDDYEVSPEKVSLKRRPSIVYNALINPLIPFAVKGVLWYQGESNMNNPEVYGEYIKCMIGEYRKRWEREFPIYFVQIANYLKNTPEDKLPWIREAQTAALDLSKVYMASTIDIGNKHDVHPKNKQEIGKRLANLALKYTYGNKNISADHPEIIKAKINNNKITLLLRKSGELKLKHGVSPEGFQIAGNEGTWLKAEAVIYGDKIILSHAELYKPAYVRHAWQNNPVINVTDESGLPLLPFRTDKFKRIVK